MAIIWERHNDEYRSTVNGKEVIVFPTYDESESYRVWGLRINNRPFGPFATLHSAQDYVMTQRNNEKESKGSILNRMGLFLRTLD